jgi:hypothetical protein
VISFLLFCHNCSSGASYRASLDINLSVPIYTQQHIAIISFSGSLSHYSNVVIPLPLLSIGPFPASVGSVSLASSPQLTHSARKSTHTLTHTHSFGSRAGGAEEAQCAPHTQTHAHTREPTSTATSNGAEADRRRGCQLTFERIKYSFARAGASAALYRASGIGGSARRRHVTGQEAADSARPAARNDELTPRLAWTDSPPSEGTLRAGLSAARRCRCSAFAVCALLLLPMARRQRQRRSQRQLRRRPRRERPAK